MTNHRANCKELLPSRVSSMSTKASGSTVLWSLLLAKQSLF